MSLLNLSTHGSGAHDTLRAYGIRLLLHGNVCVSALFSQTAGSGSHPWIGARQPTQVAAGA
jgi:hypothetical protein